MEFSVEVSVRVRTEECVTLWMGRVDVGWAGPDNIVKKVNKCTIYTNNVISSMEFHSNINRGEKMNTLNCVIGFLIQNAFNFGHKMINSP